jgi:hypothetical protein
VKVIQVVCLEGIFMRHDPKNPNAWWVTREDINEDIEENLWDPSGKQDPKIIRRNKKIFCAMLVLGILIAVYFEYRPLHWLAQLH